jgi:hypothetical protein
LRSAAPIGTMTSQIYVYMQVVRGKLGEIYVYIALQASPLEGIVSRLISTRFGTLSPLSMFSINQLLSFKRTKPLYIHLGLGFEFEI